MFREVLLLIINPDPDISQSTQRMTIPTAVYTQLILLIMSNKPAGNM
jgi:hypothetical protein